MLIIQKNLGTELFSLLIQEHLSGAVFKSFTSVPYL